MACRPDRHRHHTIVHDQDSLQSCCWVRISIDDTLSSHDRGQCELESGGTLKSGLLLLSPLWLIDRSNCLLLQRIQLFSRSTRSMICRILGVETFEVAENSVQVLEMGRWCTKFIANRGNSALLLGSDEFIGIVLGRSPAAPTVHYPCSSK